MNLEKFENYLVRIRSRVNDLNTHTFDEPVCESNGTLQAAIEELNTSLEELQVAEEELRGQNEQLQESQQLLETERQRYQDLFEFAPGAYLVTDMEGTIHEANRAAATLFNLEQRFLPRKPLVNYVAPDERRAFRDHLFKLRFLTTPDTEWVVCIHPRNQADPVPVAITTALIHDNSGTPIALRWMMQDISRRVRAEQALQHSEARYRAIYQGTPSIYFVLDAEARVLSINEFGAESLGYTVEELLGKHAGMVVHEDDREETVQRFHIGMGDPDKITYWELRKVCKNGNVIWVKDTMRVIPDRDGTNVALIICQDVTDLKTAEHNLEIARTELELRVSERTRELSTANRSLQSEIIERELTQQCLTQQAHKLECAEEIASNQARILQSVLDSMSEGVVVVDENMKLLLANPAAQKMFNNAFPADINLAEHAQDFGLYFHDMVTPFPTDEMPLQRALRGEDAAGIEMYVRHKQRRNPGWVNVSARAIHDGEGILRGAVAVFTDITKRKWAEHHLKSLAQYDVLTGLPNRNLFRETLRQAMTRASRAEKTLALLFLDLDHFKDINDTLGHDAGDMALKAMAERLKGCLREGDTIARLGGDEFTMILENVNSAEDIADVAQKILDTLAQPFLLEGREILLTTSIGITLYPADVDDSDNMLKKADIAMYQAKAQGRNNYQFYAPEMTLRAALHLNMEGKLRHALERGELLPYYQPQVDLNTGEISGVEVLLRWRHPEFGLIPGARFISLAEKTGLIVPIGDWLMKTACMQIKAWHDAGLGQLRIAVNQSARQFRRINMVSAVASLLADVGLEPHYLDLEITEELLMENTQANRAVFTELRALGVHISIDDFGTGYSSLSYLKQFPLDCLKIDQSFVQNLPCNVQDAAITTAIITLAHNLHLRVIAEGVETKEQMAFLHSQGCEEIQGYIFGKPMPADELTALLQKGRRLAVVRLSGQVQLM